MELALVLPLLTLLFLGVIDLGLVIWEYQVLQNSVREGARFSSLPRSWIDPRNPGASEAAIKQRVIDYLLEEGITVPATNVNVTQRYPVRAGELTTYGSEVSVTYDRALLVSGGGILPFARVTLEGRSVFRNLY